MKNGRKFEVVKHGDLHDEAIICPECLKDIKNCDLVARKDENSSKMVIFTDIFEVFTYKCPECGCEFQEKRRKKRAFNKVRALKICGVLCILLCFVGFGIGAAIDGEIGMTLGFAGLFGAVWFFKDVI